MQRKKYSGISASLFEGLNLLVKIMACDWNGSRYAT